jgi:hypothetical protein
MVNGFGRLITEGVGVYSLKAMALPPIVRSNPAM